MALKMIDLYYITSSFLKSSPSHYSRSIKQLYVARVISTHSTAGLLQWISSLIAPKTPR